MVPAGSMPHVYGKDKRDRGTKGTIKLELKVFLRFKHPEMGGTKHIHGMKSGFGLGNFLNFSG